MQAPRDGQPFAAAEEGVPPEPQQPEPQQPQPQQPEPQPEPQPLAASSTTQTAATTAGPAVPMGGDEFPDEALALVCSFVELRQLGRLACVSRRFTEPTLTEPGSGAKLSAIEEGARLQFMSGAGADGGAMAARRLEGETWMRALWRTQYRLRWAKGHPAIEMAEDGRLAVLTTSVGMSYASALGSHVLQADGDAYAEFTYVSDPGGTNLFVGISRPHVDVSTAFGSGIAGSTECRMYRAMAGQCRDGHGLRSVPWVSGKGKQRFGEGMVLGLRLRHGSLRAYMDGQQLGVMCEGLSGEFVWAADLGSRGESVRIVRLAPPQT